MRRRVHAAGFTLVELLIALAIVGALLAIAFGGLRMAVVAWARGEERAEFQQHTRGLTQIIGRAISAAYPYQGAFGEAPEKRLLFRGEGDRVEFVTQNPPFPSVIRAAFTAVVITVEDAPEGRGLVVRQRILPNREPFSEAAVVLRDTGIHGLDVRYLGRQGGWTDSWDADNERGLPAAIRITFTMVRQGRLEPAPPLTASIHTVGDRN
jgi:general secretion pathway protein J